MLNVAPQKERIPDHLRVMAEQDDKSAASGKTGEQSSIVVGCAPGEERDSAISICAVHSATVTAAIAEYCEDTVEKQKTLTEVLDGLVELTTRLAASLATARRSAIVGIGTGCAGCDRGEQAQDVPITPSQCIASMRGARYSSLCCWVSSAFLDVVSPLAVSGHIRCPRLSGGLSEQDHINELRARMYAPPCRI